MTAARRLLRTLLRSREQRRRMDALRAELRAHADKLETALHDWEAMALLADDFGAEVEAHVRMLRVLAALADT